MSYPNKIKNILNKLIFWSLITASLNCGGSSYSEKPSRNVTNKTIYSEQSIEKGIISLNVMERKMTKKLVELNNNSYEFNLKVYNIVYDLEFTFEKEYTIKEVWGYTNDWREYKRFDVTREPTGNSRIVLRSSKIKSKSPAKNKFVKIRSDNSKIKSKTLKTDNFGEVNIPISLDDNKFVITKIKFENITYTTSAYKHFNENYPHQVYDNLKILTDQIPDSIKLSNGKKFKFDPYKGYAPSSASIASILLSSNLLGENFSLEKDITIYTANRADLTSKVKKEEEDRSARSLFESIILKNLSTLYIHVLDEDNGLPINGAEVSITSNAQNPIDQLIRNGFPQSKLKDFSIPNYPNSWDGKNRGNWVYCKIYDRPCSFVTYQTAKHKVIVKHPDYYQVDGELTPIKDGLEYIVEMSKIGTKIKLDINPFGGKGNLRKK